MDVNFAKRPRAEASLLPCIHTFTNRNIFRDGVCGCECSEIFSPSILSFLSTSPSPSLSPLPYPFLLIHVHALIYTVTYINGDPKFNAFKCWKACANVSSKRVIVLCKHVQHNWNVKDGKRLVGSHTQKGHCSSHSNN